MATYLHYEDEPVRVTARDILRGALTDAVRVTAVAAAAAAVIILSDVWAVIPW